MQNKEAILSTAHTAAPTGGASGFPTTHTAMLMIDRLQLAHTGLLWGGDQD